MTVNRLIGMIIWLFIVEGGVLGETTLQAQTLTPKVCSSLFDLKAFYKSAICYEKLVKKMNKIKKLSRFQKRILALHTRNAVIAFQKSAERTNKREKKLYLFEKSALLSRFYLKKKLCSKSYQCNEIRAILQKDLEAINYSTLTFVSLKSKPVHLEIEGYQFRAKLTLPPNWAHKLRPGRYTIKIVEGKILKKKWAIELIPGKARIITFSPSQSPQPSIDKLPLTRPMTKRVPPPSNSILVPAIIAGSGVAVALLGGGLIMLAINNANQIKDLTKAQDVKNKRELAKTQYLIGWGILGVGTAAIITGSILLFFQGTSSSSSSSQPPRSTSEKSSTLSPSFQILHLPH